MFWLNLKSVASPVPEIIAIGVLVPFGGGVRASGMLPFERALVSSYRSNLCGPDPPTLLTDRRTDGHAIAITRFAL